MQGEIELKEFFFKLQQNAEKARETLKLYSVKTR